MEPVSVVIPTYNRAALLPKALESVLAATEHDDDIIVVDDGSTDKTETVMERYAPRVRYLRVSNGGAGAARNAGIAACRHDLIAFADSDDEWLAHRLRVQRPLMESDRSLAFTFSDFGQIHRDGRREMSFVRNWSGDERPWSEILGPGRCWSELTGRVLPDGDPLVHTGSIYARELEANYININTLLVRRSVTADALRFAVDLPTYEDWECFARISKAGQCAYVDMPTAMQRSHGGPRLTDASKLTELDARIRIIERNWLADATFTSREGDRARAIVADLRRRRARILLLAGRNSEARQDLLLVDQAPLERIAQYIPSALIRWLARASHAFRR